MYFFFFLQQLRDLNKKSKLTMLNFIFQAKSTAILDALSAITHEPDFATINSAKVHTDSNSVLRAINQTKGKVNETIFKV